MTLGEQKQVALEKHHLDLVRYLGILKRKTVCLGVRRGPGSAQTLSPPLRGGPIAITLAPHGGHLRLLQKHLCLGDIFYPVV